MTIEALLLDMVAAKNGVPTQKARIRELLTLAFTQSLDHLQNVDGEKVEPYTLPLEYYLRPEVPLSALEDALLSYLPLWDESETEELNTALCNRMKEVGCTADGLVPYLMEHDPELAEKALILGIRNSIFLHEIQFCKLFSGMTQSSPYSFSAKYRACAAFDFMGGRALNIQEFDYPPASTYLSLFFKLTRQFYNLDESIYDMELPMELVKNMRRVWQGKKVLEIGCGPGFFLYLLQHVFGAEVSGLELDDTYIQMASKQGLHIIQGNALELEKHFSGEQFDVIFSKDVLSMGVTGTHGDVILKKSFDILKPDGFAFHEVYYRQRKEEEYLRLMKEAMSKLGMEDSVSIKWDKLTIEEKQMVLCTNVLNVGPATATSSGYELLQHLTMDSQDNLTLLLHKPKK